MPIQDLDYFKKNIYSQIRPLFGILDLEQIPPTQIKELLLDDIEENRNSLIKLGNNDVLLKIFTIACYFIWLRNSKIKAEEIPLAINAIVAELDKYYIPEKDFYTFPDKMELWKREQENPESIIFYFQKNNISPFYIPNILRIFWWYMLEDLVLTRLTAKRINTLFKIQKLFYRFVFASMKNQSDIFHENVLRLAVKDLEIASSGGKVSSSAYNLQRKKAEELYRQFKEDNKQIIVEYKNNPKKAKPKTLLRTYLEKNIKENISLRTFERWAKRLLNNDGILIKNDNNRA